MKKTSRESQVALSKSDVEDRVWNRASGETIDPMISFGQMLFSEVQQRSAQIDSKVSMMIGLAGAMLAFLLVGNELWTSTLKIAHLTAFRVALCFAVILLLVGITCAYKGARLQGWDVPSQSDWIQLEFLKDPDKLKRYHLISISETIRDHNRANAIKSRDAKNAQYAIAAAGIVVGVSLFLRIALQLLAI